MWSCFFLQALLYLMFRNSWPRRSLPCDPFLAPSWSSLSDFEKGLDDDLLLCPVRCLREYLKRTSGGVNHTRRLFVSPRNPSGAMSKNAISYFTGSYC